MVVSGSHSSVIPAQAGIHAAKCADIPFVENARLDCRLYGDDVKCGEAG